MLETGDGIARRRTEDSVGPTSQRDSGVEQGALSVGDLVATITASGEVGCRSEREKMRRQVVECAGRLQPDRGLEGPQSRFGRRTENAVGTSAHGHVGRDECSLQGGDPITAGPTSQ